MSGVTVSEAGGTDSYTVKLDSQPTGNVTVTMTSNNAAATVAPPSLSFTTGNWNATQTVTVTGQDDAIDNPGNQRTATITHAVSGGDYNSVTAPAVSVTVTDDEGPQPVITITAVDSPVTEGAPAQFRVTANPAPSSTRTVSLTITQAGGYVANANLGAKTVDITTSGAVTYSVATVGDAIDKANGTVTATLANGTGYTVGNPATATVNVNDNDTRGVSISASGTGVVVSEAGGTAQYTVQLTSEPTGNVTVTPSVTGPATVSGAMTFTTGNWNVTQTVTVTGVDDDVDNPGNQRTATITHAVSAAGSDYNGLTALAVTVTVTDDEGPVPSVSITARTSVTEGQPIVFTITGDQAPDGDVPVNLRVVVADDNGGGSTATQTATIPANGRTATYTVTTTNDELDETGSSVTVTVVGGAGYTIGGPATAMVTVNDNDLSGVSIEALNSRIIVGSAADFRVTATTMQERALNVRVRITSTGVSGVSRNRTVTVTIPQDQATAVHSVAIRENSPPGTVIATLLTDTRYVLKSPSAATVTVADRPPGPVARPSFEAGQVVTTRQVSRPGEIALHVDSSEADTPEENESLRYEWVQVSGPASTFLQASIYRDGNFIDGAQRFRGGELWYPVTQAGDVVIYRVSGCETKRTVTVPAGTAIVNANGDLITEANEVVYEVVKPDDLKRTPQFRVNSPGGAFHWWRFVHDQDDDGEWIAVAVSGGVSSSILTRHGTLGRISEPFCKTDAQGRKVGASPTGGYTFRLTVTDPQGRSHSAEITAAVTDTLPPVTVAKVTSVYQADRDRQILCSTEPDALVRCGNSDIPDTLDTSNSVQPPGGRVTLSGRDSKTNVDGRLTYSWEQTCTDSSSGRVIRVECPVAVTLSGAKTVTPSFTSPELTEAYPDHIDLSFTLTVTDQHGNRDSDRVHLTIEDANPEIQIPPQAHIEDGRSVKLVGGRMVECSANDHAASPPICTYESRPPALENTSVTLDGSGSNDSLDNGRIVSYLWEQIAGTGGTLTNANRSRAMFLTPTELAAHATFRFRLTVTDNDGLTDTAEVGVLVLAELPTADAGERQTVAEGESVTLTGSGSNFGVADATLTYAWTYRGDRPGTPDLSGLLPALNTAEVAFDAPSGLTRDAYYQFTLTVSGDGRSASDTVHVTVTAADKRPVADAGPDQTAEWGRRVRLTSVGSLNPYGADPLRYSWRQTSGTPAVELDDPSSSLPDFILPSQPPVGTAASNALRFELTVTDREGVTDTGTVTVTVTNRRPTANAGSDRNVAWNDSVTLDGSDSSDPRNDGVSANFHKPLQYRWRQKSGAPVVTLRNANNAEATFHLPGWWRGLHGDNVTLVFELTVTDARGAADTGDVTVSVSWQGPDGSGASGKGGPDPDPSPPPEPQAPVAPTANAGPDLTGAPGESVTLQGKGSTNPYGRWYQMTHSWTQLSGPTVALDEPTHGDPAFTIPADAADGTTLEFRLAVMDEKGESDSDTMIVTVAPPETIQPTAKAGPDLTGAPGESVTLQGKGSRNPYGRWHQMAHQWTQLSGPLVTLTHPKTSQPASKFADPSFTIPADAAGMVKLEFQLTVTDKEGVSDSDTMTVTVTGDVPDTNDPPVFDAGPSAAFSLSENTVTGENVGLPLTAQDPDNDVLTYSLSDTDAASFDIDAASGQLTTREGVIYDYETQQTYEVTVTASDGNGGSATISVTVSVTDANDPPVFDAGPSAAFSLSENTVAGENVGEPLTATDPDEDTLTYSLSGDDAASFDLNAATGQLTTREGVTYDYETQAAYAVAVTAEDPDGASASIAVTVSLTDANDAPTFAEGDGATRTLAENTAAGENVGEPLTATDADEDTLTYTLSGDDADSFEIDAATGQLLTKAGVSYDYETQATYAVAVTAEDPDGASASIDVTVNLTDANDAPPPLPRETAQPAPWPRTRRPVRT